MRVVLLSNVTLDMLAKTLSESHSVYPPAGFGQWVQAALNPDEELLAFRPEAIFLLLDGNALLEAAPENTEEELRASLSYVEALAEKFPAAKIYAPTIDFGSKRIAPKGILRREYALQRLWEAGLDELTGRRASIRVFDVRLLIENMGRDAFYSDKMWYLGSMPYSMKGVNALARAIDRAIQQSRAAKRKVLVMDLDNTLWGGVLGEDGPDGIELSGSLMGAVFKDTQRRILELRAAGVLLAVVSKNDDDEARAVINAHPHMLLREDCFVKILANWTEKPDNIRRLARELNLGLDSFVFLDDNPVEREAVRLALPDVAVADFPRDKANLPAAIQEVADVYFYTESLTDEDSARSRQYAEDTRRKESRSAYGSLDEYLLSLDVSIALGEMRETQVERVAQLTRKTNQFNLTAARFDTAGLKEYAASPNHHVFTATVSDKYGDNGLVFVAMISREGPRAEIDNLLMSCRVMGRHIEDSSMTAIESILRDARSVDTLLARYIPTGRNAPVQHLLERLDFTLERESNDGVKRYSRRLGDAPRQRKQLFAVTLCF